MFRNCQSNEGTAPRDSGNRTTKLWNMLVNSTQPGEEQAEEAKTTLRATLTSTRRQNQIVVRRIRTIPHASKRRINKNNNG
eukprot:4860833-Amphidinium_carterae.1